MLVMVTHIANWSSLKMHISGVELQAIRLKKPSEILDTIGRGYNF